MEPITTTSATDSFADNMTPAKKGITGSTLKIIAISTMFIDHFAAFVLDSYLAANGLNDLDPMDIQASMEWMSKYAPIYYADVVMRCIGRLAFPIFIFLLVEGFVHTRNRMKYAIRLFVFALVSEIPFNLSHTGYALSEPTTFAYQSVFWTLLAGFLFMWYANFIEEKETPQIAKMLLTGASLILGGFTGTRCLGLVDMVVVGMVKAPSSVSFAVKFAITVVGLLILYIVWSSKKGKEKALELGTILTGLFVLMLAADYGNTDYGAWGVLAIAFAYFFKGTNKGKIIAPVVILTIMQFIEAFAFFDVLFIKSYNGKRGLKLKYFFYAFYPLHLLLFYMISWFMGCQPGRLFLGF